ncbi:predicted protein [Coccidioides posadasii str. Silveira]|uniref:Predicted protein n=1 Tax=Coccidioides posadasii (strain RMSCC 757 / Silveira) TaxID=443226 RepID=E9DEN3_COCPS|nr:predicted protein [Coccidioides posadasii str. Silveira]
MAGMDGQDATSTAWPFGKTPNHEAKEGRQLRCRQRCGWPSASLLAGTSVVLPCQALSYTRTPYGVQNTEYGVQTVMQPSNFNLLVNKVLRGEHSVHRSIDRVILSLIFQKSYNKELSPNT